MKTTKKHEDTSLRDFLEALDEIQKTKGIDKEEIIEAVEAAIASAYKKDVKGSQNVRVEVDRETGEIEIFAQRIVVKDAVDKINEISPNKSWEGCLGGTFFGTLISVLFYLIIVNQDVNLFLLIFITIFLSIIGQLGDLFFSLIKRHYQIKDFSNIMPGHGGILDRLDSVIFIALAFIFFINFLI